MKNKLDSKLMRQFLIIVFFSLLFILPTHSQINETGLPFINNYTINDYNAGTQNWSIVQDKRGIIYVANKLGVLQYDGLTWQLLKLTNGSDVFSLAIDNNDIVYVGAKSEFGFLAPDSLGRLNYQSLSMHVDSTHRDFGTVTTIIADTNAIYFSTKHTIVKYKKNKNTPLDSINWSNKFEFINYPKGFVTRILYQVNNRLFAVTKSDGLAFLDNDSIYSIDFELKAEKKYDPWTILPYPGERAMYTSSKKIYLFDYKKCENAKISCGLEILHSEVDDFIAENRAIHGVLNQNGNYTFATLKKGIVEMSPQGDFISQINEKNRLQDDMVTYLYNDTSYHKDACLWAATNNGISNVEINSPIRQWNEKNGLRGTVYDVLRFDSTLYVASSVGLYYMTTDENGYAAFELVKNIEEMCWCLEVYSVQKKEKNERLLLAGTQNGIYKVEHNRAVEIVETPPVLALYMAKNKPVVYIGLKNSLSVMTYSNGNAKYAELLGFEQRVRNIEEDKNGNIWLGSDEGSVVRLKNVDILVNPPTERFVSISLNRFDAKNGLANDGKISVHSFHGEVAFFSGNKIYRYDEKKDTFRIEPALNTYIDADLKEFFRFVEDSAGNCWIRATGKTHDWLEVLLKKEKNSYERDTFPFKRIPFMSVQTIYPEKNGVTWIGGSEGLFSYDRNIQRTYQQKYYTVIRKVMLGEDSVICYGTNFTYHCPATQNRPDSVMLPENLEVTVHQAENLIPSLKYRHNNLTFSFSAPYFEKQDAIVYSHKLEGFETKWSKWNAENKAVYTNLGEGTYTFKVKAKNIYGVESEIAEYSFIILPPWYRTYWAYTVYVVLLIFIVWGLIKLNTRRLIREKKRLEQIVKERTAEIINQKEEIQAQAEQLEETNKELEKLSIVASETDNAIVIMDKDGNFEWVNVSFTRLFGYTLTEMQNKDTANIAKLNTEDYALDLIQFCKEEKKTVNYESLVKTKSEDKIWVQVTITPILDFDDDITKLIAVNSDITNLKLAENEILQQKEEIEAQRDELEVQRDVARKQRDQIAEQQKHIMDSIHYARRIQSAVLPPETIINQVLSEHFILYKPRDIVSGDFYWMTQRESRLVFAAADCTGHGVPGAFMSMLGVAFLNEIVNQAEVHSNTKLKANEVLNQLREHVINSLRQTGKEGEAKDGMDISLCIVDMDSGTLQFSGAYNPVYIVRNIENGNEESSEDLKQKTKRKIVSNERYKLFQLNADRMPIGIHFGEQKQFTNQEAKLQKGDTLYIFSDGYVDQFGGEEGRKFMTKRFKKLLISIQDENLKVQKKRLDKTIEGWMTGYEQVDDILVMGVRI